MKKSVFLMIIVVNMFGALSPFHVLSQNILNSVQQKKAERVLSSIWKKSEIEQININFNISPVPNSLNKINLTFDLRKITINDKHQAWVVYNYAESMYDKFLFMVVYDLELNIIRVRILEYPELYGTEITSQVWLNKFNGKNASETLKYRSDLDAISGATLSAVNLIERVNQSSEILIFLKNSNQLR